MIIAILLVVALVGPTLAPNDPLKIELLRRLENSSREYPLGADHLGRCVLSRLLYGSRISLGASVVVSALLITIGLVVGLMAGLFGGKLDGLIMRLVDVFLSFPSLVLALAVIGIIGPSMKSAVIGICLAWWPVYARLIRGMVLSAKERDFVMASRVVGTHGYKLVRFCILPQILPSILVLASLEIGMIILVFSGLSFLGLGVQAPTPEWGAMLNDARYFIQTAPSLMVLPGLAISLAVLGFNLFGEGLRDVLNVREMTRW